MRSRNFRRPRFLANSLLNRFFSETGRQHLANITYCKHHQTNGEHLRPSDTSTGIHIFLADKAMTKRPQRDLTLKCYKISKQSSPPGSAVTTGLATLKSVTALITSCNGEPWECWQSWFLEAPLRWPVVYGCAVPLIPAAFFGMNFRLVKLKTVSSRNKLNFTLS